MSGSRWSSAIAQADLATSSVAKSYLKVTHVNKARKIHQVTAAGLYHLLHDAYQEENSELGFHNELERGVNNELKSGIMFKYWVICHHHYACLLTSI